MINYISGTIDFPGFQLTKQMDLKSICQAAQPHGKFVAVYSNNADKVSEVLFRLPVSVELDDTVSICGFKFTTEGIRLMCDFFAKPLSVYPAWFESIKKYAVEDGPGYALFEWGLVRLGFAACPDITIFHKITQEDLNDLTNTLPLEETLYVFDPFPCINLKHATLLYHKEQEVPNGDKDSTRP